MIRTPPHKQPPPPHHPPHPTREPTTDRHTLDRFRGGTMGRTLAPSGMPHALSHAPSVPSRTPLARLGCARA